MKNVFIAFLATFMFFNLTGQEISVNEGTKTMREGSFNAFDVELNDVATKTAEDAWKDFIKDYDGKTKKDKKQNLLVSENVSIPSIGRNPVDVYAMISEDKYTTGSILHVWFDTGSGYVNSIDMEAQAESATAVISEFATKVLKSAALEAEKLEKSNLERLESDMKKLVNKNDQLRKDIAKAQDNILKWEKELAQNEDDQAKKKKEIKNQSEKVEEATEKAKNF